MEWMMMPLQRYADFQGRSCRMEYWMYTLGVIIAMIVFSVVEGVIGLRGWVLGVYGPLTALLVLGTFVPSLAAGFRRLHDTDRSAWFLLIGLIPFVGGIVLLVLFCLEGTQGPNRFGTAPSPAQS